MTKRAYNFNAGPAALPLEVLEQAKEQLTDYKGIGMSVMEISHRSKEYEEINQTAQDLFAELLNLPAGYKVLFLQGGASSQFAMIPMNLLTEGKTAHYVLSGSWAKKAIHEAKAIGNTVIAAEPEQFTKVPDLSGLNLGDDAAYLHLTSNETIEGIQYDSFPDTGNVPLVADMSSDFLCRPLDVSAFDLIYAGAQKNLGPSGVTVVIMKEDLLTNIPADLPTMFRYDTHVKANSLYNTPPVFSVYMVQLVLEWVKNNGGLAAMEQRNKEKTDLISDVIDQSNGFYRGTVEEASRSIMNIPFRLQTEDLEQQFLEQATRNGFIGLKGHRSVGGLRASTYNAVPRESCQALADFMQQFMKDNG